MNINDYVLNRKEIYNELLDFIENDNENEDLYTKLILSISNQKILEDKEEIKAFLQLILSISNNHYRVLNFFIKIKKIINYLKNYLKQFLSNSELIDIFRNNKVLLLYLIEINIIFIDKTNFNVFLIQNDKVSKYDYFFYPQYKKFITKEQQEEIEKEILDTSDIFNEKCHIGENDSYICNLIRNDSIDKFISFINQTNISLSSQISKSVFETNSFLLKKKDTTLIEYAAFFGSISIFKYLMFNNVKLTNSLWLYAIHSNNAELISLIEENKVDIKSYNEIIEESISCHHNNLTDYFLNNTAKNKFAAYKSIYYMNYYFFPSDYIEDYIIFFACIWNLDNLFEKLLTMKGTNVNKKFVSNLFFINYIQNHQYLK